MSFLEIAILIEERDYPDDSTMRNDPRRKPKKTMGSNRVGRVNRAVCDAAKTVCEKLSGKNQKRDS
jgi:hypothetical protein